jgi:hypothetical protein
MSSDANLYRVVRSPYLAVRKGAFGTVLRKKFVGSTVEAWEMDFGPLGKWYFLPREVERLD